MESDYARLERALADRYVLTREIGRGGMATVYLATEPRRNRAVAIKVLDPSVADLLGRQRFVREVEIVARLDHPGIVPIFAAGEADGLLYFVMPFIDGSTLRNRLAMDGRLPLPEALAIGRDVAEALAHAHARGVVHRDIKPENILLSGRTPVVADFGIAKALITAGGDTLTRTGFVVGTPRYMSPEQAEGMAVDERTDIYALGRVLYETLLGDVPPDEPAGLEHEMASVPAPVATLLRRALAPELQDRILDARGLAAALDAAIHETRGLTDRPTTPPMRTLATAGLALLLIGFLVVAALAIF